MLLIDTSNVLHVTGVLPGHLAGLDVPGLARLISTSRYSRRRAVLVSDGVGPRAAAGASEDQDGGGAPQPVNTAPSGREIAGLDVVYSGADREADDVIELLIARDSAPRRLLVVSTDRRLVRAARRRRARSLTSEDFLRQIAGDSERKPKPELPGFAAQVPLNSYAVGYWMSLFGYGDEPGEERTPGIGPVADISEAARRGLDDDRARRRAKSPHAHEGLKIPKDLLGANGSPRTTRAPNVPSPPRETEVPTPDLPSGPLPSGDLPQDVLDLIKDSGLNLDPADLDMTKWLPKDDNSPPLALIVTMLAGCQTSERYQGESRTVATWRGRTLSVELPDAVTVPGAHYAAVEALLARGYAIEADEATRDRGYLAAKGPDGTALGGYKRVVVRTGLTPSAVGLGITLEPAGDEVTARAILDDVLVRLGL